MQCTASEKSGLFECNCCLLEALQRCRKQNPQAFSKWGAQLRQEDPERYQIIKAELEGVKNE